MYSFRSTGIFCTLLLLSNLNAVGQASSLTFQDALSVAVEEAPTVRLSGQRVDAAHQAVIPAGQLPDPKLILGLDNVPIEGPDQYSLSRDFMTMRTIGIMQEFPNQAKLDARIATARSQVALAESQIRITEIYLRRETAIAWIARYSIEKQLAQMDRLVEENRLFAASVKAMLAGNNGSVTDLIAPRQEAAMIEDRRDELNAQREKATANLKRWIGQSAELPLIGDPPDLPILHTDLKRSLHQHPDLTLFDSKMRLLDAEVAEVVADKRPDWGLELMYQDRSEVFGDMVSLQATFDLPLFAGKRQNPKIVAKKIERNALDAERESIEREHLAMLESDLADYHQLDKAVKRQRNVLLPLAEEKVTLAMASYRAGKGGLADVVEARRERVDAELQAIALEGERQQFAARLHYSYIAVPENAEGEQP